MLQILHTWIDGAPGKREGPEKQGVAMAETQEKRQENCMLCRVYTLGNVHPASCNATAALIQDELRYRCVEGKPVSVEGLRD